MKELKNTKLLFIVLMCFITNISSADTCTIDSCEVDLKSAIDWAHSKGARAERDLRPDEPRKYDWETTSDIDIITEDNYLLITEMNISGKGLSDDELKYLCHFKSIKKLELYQDHQEIQLTGSSLDQLRFMKDLISLDLDANQIDPKNLCLLSDNTALQELRLYDNPLSENHKGLECFSKLKSLKTILFQGSRSYKLTDSSIQELKVLENLQKLESLVFTGNLISDDGFRDTICTLKNISYLDVSANILSGHSFNCLENFQNLTILRIGTGGPYGKETNEISHEALYALSKIPNLQKLYLGSLKFSDISPLITLKNKGIKLYNLWNKVSNPEAFHISYQSDMDDWSDDD